MGVNYSMILTASSHPSRESEEQQGTLADVRQNQGGVWRIQATLMMIKREAPLWYPACPLDRCGKKVEWNNMQWYCNRCQTLYEAPEYRFGHDGIQPFNQTRLLSNFYDTLTAILPG